MPYQPLGYKQITSLSSAVALSSGSAIPQGTRMAIVQAETQNVRWRDDGTSPTASVGHVLVAGDTLVYDLGSLDAVKFIEATASAKLNVSFYG